MPGSQLTTFQIYSSCFTSSTITCHLSGYHLTVEPYMVICALAATLIIISFSSPTFSLSFRTGRGPCRASLHKQGLAQSPSCDCGQQKTRNHIVDKCPLPKFEGRLYSTKRIQSYSWNLVTAALTHTHTPV